MNVKFLFLVCFIGIQTISAQGTTSFLTIKLHEYKTFIINPGLSTIGNEATDDEIDKLFEGFIENVVRGLSAADKTALGFGAVTDEKRLKTFLRKNLDVYEYETETAAEKERTDHIRTYQGFGYAIYTIAPASPADLSKHIKITGPLKGFNHYPASTIASMKESGKKDFLAALATFNLKVGHADWREDKIKAYQVKGFNDITGTTSFAEKDHDYFGKIDEKTGARMIYELGYLPKDKGRGRVYEESFYAGMRPEVHASGTAAEQMAQLKVMFNNIREMIVKEAGNYTTSVSNILAPYTEADLNDGVKFMKALQEGKLSYSISWYSAGKQFKEKPVIYMEIHPSKMIKIKVTQNEVAE